MRTLLAVVALTGFASACGLVVRAARRGAIGRRALIFLAGLCAAGLVVMTLTDWPGEVLSRFWASHTVLSATLSTLLLVGAGYLAFEAQENLQQQRLTESLSTAAFAGLVDHMLDIDIAMALAQRPVPHPEYTTGGKPLRWIRPLRDRMAVDPAQDPRLLANSAFGETPDDGWRRDLIEQATRRLMAGMRDWAPLLTQSRDGVAVLVRIGSLRNHLVDLQRHLTADGKDLVTATAVAKHIRARCTVLALGLELSSGIDRRHLRAGVLTTDVQGLPGVASELERILHLADAGDLARLRSLIASL